MYYLFCISWRYNLLNFVKSHPQMHKMVFNPGDLGTRKRPGTSCKIEIHFWFKITQYLINDIRFLSQVCPRHSSLCERHRDKVSNSFTKESGCDKWLEVRNWISIPLLVPVLLLTWINALGSFPLKNLKIPRTESFPKISLLKVNYRLPH